MCSTGPTTIRPAMFWPATSPARRDTSTAPPMPTGPISGSAARERSNRAQTANCNSDCASASDRCRECASLVRCRIEIEPVAMAAMNKADQRLCSSDASLGMTAGITRRDFLNASLLGAGAALLDMSAPLRLLAQAEPFDGYGGVGDYANSHGNMEQVLRAAHAVRDGRYQSLPEDTTDTRELFDYVVIGGGLAGLGAAYEFKRTMRPGQTCLILENHPIFGGEAKRNEFVVRGQRLIGPQGSNDFVVPSKGMLENEPDYDIWDQLRIPRQFQWQSWDPKLKPLEFSRENYVFMYWGDRSPSLGWYFDEKPFKVKPTWVADMFERKMEGTPFPQKVRNDFEKWRTSHQRYYSGKDYQAWL